MARTALATQTPTAAGVTVTMSAANVDGHTLDGDGSVLLLVENGSGSSINVTVQTPKTVGGLAVTDQVVAVAAGALKAIGPFESGLYDRADTEATDPGKVWVDFSAVTTVTCAALAV